MIIISSSEFRNKQREYFDRVDRGDQVIIQRGDNQAYKLTPVTDEDMYFTPEMIEKIKRSIQQAEAGNVISLKTPAELNAYLDSF
ncbi:type II toxin-antitoxin system Phd/YefM family antitoxin [Parabacteroides sp. PF5-6]|uniref:type II toxin-antitoxin system Phd/YefM family antitoxin n=1 Tax=Parabacteroides sp. PF5-6 TaxID=1742403 RepID=UPI002405282D|nr:type II toxin-antitoxin system Phd/YefM family antitoxin [Parabacteroides sp. PF5-6]MDF9830704.1 antitoxin YefM [Parabacteroides sp. PF5-6]